MYDVLDVSSILFYSKRKIYILKKNIENFPNKFFNVSIAKKLFIIKTKTTNCTSLIFRTFLWVNRKKNFENFSNNLFLVFFDSSAAKNIKQQTKQLLCITL